MTGLLLLFAGAIRFGFMANFVVGLGMLLVLAYISAPLSHVPIAALAAVIEVSLPDAEASDKRLFEATAGGRPCAS